MELEIVFIAGSTFFVAIVKDVPPDMDPVTQLLHIFASILRDKYTVVPTHPDRIKYIPL
jgi:hypothetical protein